MIDQFCNYIHDRERIRLLKESGLPQPWTSDPILDKWHFTNVHREHDKTSRHEFKVAAAAPRVNALLYIILLRHTISPRVADCLFNFNTFTALSNLWEVMDRGFVSEALRFNVPPGHTQLSWTWEFSQIARYLVDGLLPAARHDHPQWLFDELKTLPTIGSFRAYEIVTSLTYLDWCKWDENAMIYIGPGAVRAIQTIIGEPATALERVRYMGSAQRDRLGESYLPSLKEIHATVSPLVAPMKFTYRTCEDCLCEFRKYLDIKTTGRGRRIYRP